MKKIINILLFILLSLSTYSQLYISNGTNFVMTSGQLTISDMDFDNDGTFTRGTGTVNFKGTSDQTILGTSTTTFNNVVINNANDLLVDDDFNVYGELKMTSGELDLQNSVVSLGTTGKILNETETNRIKVGNPDTEIGTITIDRNIAAGTYSNILLGNIGIILVTDKALNVTIIRGHKVQVGMDSNESIERYYEISGIDSMTTTNYIEMSYFDIELNGIAQADLIFFQTVSYDGTSWWSPCYTTISSNTATFNTPTYYDWIYEHSITFEDKFTLASKLLPLPIELLSFGYSCENMELEWTTSSEQNNDYFTIEKSSDMINWEFVGDITGQGNSNVRQNYSYKIDDNNQIYYRLCQFDYDNTEECFNTIYIDCEMSNVVSVYPNPSNSSVDISGWFYTLTMNI